MSSNAAGNILARDAPAKTVQHVVNDISWEALGPALACTLLAIIVVTLRWYTRVRISRCIGLDDYVILFSTTLSCLMTTLIALQVRGGIGTYDKHLSPISIAKLITVNNGLWVLIVNITKASILLQYLRIFSNRGIRIICITLLLLLIPAACWGVFAGTFMCTPMAALWNPAIPGHCLDGRTYWLSVAGLDISMDFFILILPLPAMFSLRLPRKQKISLVLIFSLGFFVCVISVVRLATVLAASLEGDHIAASLWSIVWSAVEANVGIICASLLALKPLLLHIFPKVLEESAPPRYSTTLRRVEGSSRMSGSVKKGSGKAHMRSASGTTDSGSLGERSACEAGRSVQVASVV